MSIAKCELEPTTNIILLGVQSDSIAQRFFIPEHKLDKLEARCGRWENFVPNTREGGRQMREYVSSVSGRTASHAFYV